MMVTNDVLNDPRVQKEARLAARNGFEVYVVGHFQSPTLERVERRDGYTILRVDPQDVRGIPGPGSEPTQAWPSPEELSEAEVPTTCRAAWYTTGQLPEEVGRLPIWSSYLARCLVWLPTWLLVSMWKLRLPADLWRIPLRALKALGGLLRRPRMGLQSCQGRLRALHRFLRQNPLPDSGRLATEVDRLGDELRSEDRASAAPEFTPVALETLEKLLSVPDPENDAWSFWWTLNINMAFADVVIRLRPEIVHSNDLNALLAGGLAKRKLGCKLVYDSHELWTEEHHARTDAWKVFWKSLERLLIRRADRVLTVNCSIASELASRYDVPEPLAVYNAPFYTPPPDDVDGERRLLRERVGGARIVLYQGRYDVGRGLEELIESMRYLEHVVLALRGFGIAEELLRQRARELGVADRVLFLDPVPMADLVRTAAAADIGVIPYKPVCLNYYYCTPNKLFEYMMAGIAVATSDLPELRRIVIGEDLGRVFDPKSPQSIAAALGEILADDQTLERMKESSKRAARTYNWDEEGKKLIATYQDLLGSQPGSPSPVPRSSAPTTR
jgi:glycogen synthase